MSDSTFDQYEYVAVITPGATFLLGLSIEWPQYLGIVANKDVSVGDLGLFLIVAYIAGQALQSAGEIIDRVFWFWFDGQPTDWVRHANSWLISAEQRTALQARVRTMLGNNDFDLGTVEKNAWRGITRQIYAKVYQAERAARINAFNRTYGLMRGFVVTLLALAIIFLAVDPGRRWLALAAAVLALLALLRFYLFGKDYARELFVQYLNT
jgi:hypothetical protein